MTDIMVAKVSFVCQLDGKPCHVNEGTTVRVGHPLLKGNGALFGPLEVDFEYTPPMKRAAQAVARKTTGGSRG